ALQNVVVFAGNIAVTIGIMENVLTAENKTLNMIGVKAANN
ncbi:3110_t:CDS:1, partial [Diversispora eburnea]